MVVARPEQSEIHRAGHLEGQAGTPSSFDDFCSQAEFLLLQESLHSSFMEFQLIDSGPPSNQDNLP